MRTVIITFNKATQFNGINNYTLIYYGSFDVFSSDSPSGLEFFFFPWKSVEPSP
jgi:hypothetical protein